MVRWLGAIGCAGTLLGGCHTGTGGNDASLFREDTGPVQMPVVGAAPGVTVDLTCIGTATLPPPGDTLTGSLHIYEFLSNAAITSTAIDVFQDNVIADTCEAPNCNSFTTDASGNITLSLPTGAWFGYRLAANGQTAPTLGYNQAWITANGGQSIGPGFAPSTISMVGRLVGRTFQADHLGSMSGRVQDCAGHTISNVLLRVFVGDTEVLNGPASDPTAPLIGGLEGTSITRTGLTGQSGNFVGANILPSDDCHVEAWGVLTDGAPAQLIGCTEGRVVIGGITVSLVTPIRSDYPAGSRCEMARMANGI